MSKILITTALACVGIIAPLAAQTAPSPAKAGITPDSAKYRAFVNQYCIACHGRRAANPAEAPVNLEPEGAPECSDSEDERRMGRRSQHLPT